MPLSDEQWTALAREMRRAAGHVAPDWTDSNAHDPGITVLELLAFAIEDLHSRTSALTPHGRLLADKVARAATALATAAGSTGAGDDCGEGLRRVAYFAGKLLDVDDFQTEQSYLLDRLARRNRLLHGAGIVDGLAVTVEGSDAASVVVIAPGLAFDPRGREIALDSPCRLKLPVTTSPAFVQLAYREHPCQSVATLPADPFNAASDDATASRPTRIVETFAATLAAAPGDDAVAVARLHRPRGRWRVDAGFKAPRVRR
jgi:hypothetical protein